MLDRTSIAPQLLRPPGVMARLDTFVPATFEVEKRIRYQKSKKIDFVLDNLFSRVFRSR
jgi:hypothetical protein